MKNVDLTARSLEASLLRYLKQKWKLPSLQYKTPPIPITGGFETSILKIQLNDTPRIVPSTLIVRIFKRHASPGKALQESSVQNAVAASGFPAPRVFLSCSDSSILGGEFNIMEYMSGTPMFGTPVGRLPETLGTMHARLHGIDPRPIIQALQAHGFDERRFTLQGQFNWMQRQIDSEGYDWLQP